MKGAAHKYRFASQYPDCDIQPHIALPIQIILVFLAFVFIKFKCVSFLFLCSERAWSLELGEYFVFFFFFTKFFCFVCLFVLFLLFANLARKLKSVEAFVLCRQKLAQIYQNVMYVHMISTMIFFNISLKKKHTKRLTQLCAENVCRLMNKNEHLFSHRIFVILFSLKSLSV